MRRCRADDRDALRMQPSWRSWVIVLASSAALTVGPGCGSSPGDDPAATAEAAVAPARPAVRFASPEASLPTRYPAPPDGKVTVGYLNPSGGQESLNALRDGFVRGVERHGGRVVTLDARLSVDAQASQFQTLIDRRVDAIAVYAIDPGALAPLVRRAARAGIPVVGLEVTQRPDQRPVGYASQVWLGPDVTAYEIARGVATALPGAKVGVIGFAAPVPYVTEIVKRIGYWGERLGLDVQGTADNPDDSIAGGVKAATALLSRHPDLDAIVTYNEDSALGAYTVVRSTGRSTQVVVFGNNGTSAGLDGVRRGKLEATWQYDAPGAGRYAADAALNAAAGVRIPPTVAIPAPRKVDASNVAAAKTWKQQLAADGG